MYLCLSLKKLYILIIYHEVKEELVSIHLNTRNWAL